MKSNGLSFHHPVAFWLGCAAVVAGVLAHMPMFAMGRMTHWQMVGMPMDNMMLTGMPLIPLGLLLATFGLMPRLEQMRQTLHGDRQHLPSGYRSFHIADGVPRNAEHARSCASSRGMCRPPMRSRRTMRNIPARW